MLLLTLKFYTMLIIPFSLVGPKRRLEKRSCLAQIYVLIFCALIHLNHAGVIKKRAIDITATTTSGNIGLGIKETEVLPPTTTALSVVGGNLATETSKELINNEIFINEATNIKKEEEEEDVITVKNETKSKTKNEEENLKNNLSTTTILENENLQDFKQIEQNLEAKETSSTEAPKITTEFSSNNIKEEKFPKLLEKQPTKTIPIKITDSNKYESSSSLENNLKINDKNLRPSSKILTELRIATEKPAIKLKIPDKQQENTIENSKEQIKTNDLKVEKEEKVIIRPREFSSFPFTNNEETVLQTKSLENSVNALEIKEEQTELSLPETTTSVPQVSENIQVLKMSKIDPLKVSESKEHHYSSNVESQEFQSNRIQDELKRQELINSAKSQNMVLTTTETPFNFHETTLKSKAKENEEGDLLIFEGDKKQYARSMFNEKTTTLNYQEDDNDDDEVLNTVTTYRPIIKETTQKSFKAQSKDLNKTAFNLKEKKPKFINDNSTNAQQLNLPNNAEVWSLAAMKSLPKANITMETAQAHNQTHKDIEENELYNSSMILNNNNEKNLLDWSQIMMDKELSTTMRNKDDTNQQEITAEKKKQNNFKNKESKIEMERQGEGEGERKDKESFMSSTSPPAEIENAQFKLQTTEEMNTKNSLIQPELTTSTMSTITTSTILSLLNYNENDNENNNQPDKKVEKSINNHTLDTLTATLPTTAATNVANNKPFNTSLNIEPNLNEINLTSNQTQIDLNNDAPQHTATTSGKKNVNDNVNANADANEITTRETNTETATPTSTITKTTKSTAVFDMTTVEQISSETTTVSTLETVKQNVSLNNIVNIQQLLQKQQQNQNQTNNVIYEKSNSSLSVSHNELENIEVDKQSGNQNENIIDLNTKLITTTTTVVPITTLRPNILAITASTFEQEVDQNKNEIQTNLTNTELQQQQSIIKIDSDFHYNHPTKAIETELTEREYETTTFEAVTDTNTATATEQIATELTASKKENNRTSSLENETATTSSSRREQINETTEINLDLIETTTTTTVTATKTTPKQVNENKNTGYEETTTGSSVLEDEKFEKGSKTATTTTTATAITATEINFSLKTSTETPVVVIQTESSKKFIESTTPATTTEENTSATTTAKQETDTKENNLSEEDAKIETKTKDMNNTQEITTTTIDTMPATAVKEEETYINLLDDTTTQSYTATISTTATSPTPTNTTTTLSPSTPPPPSPATSSELPLVVTTRVEEIYNVINSTTTEIIQTTTQELLTEISKESSSEASSTTTTTTTNIYSTEMLPPATTTTHSSQMIGTANIGKTVPTLTSIMGGNSGNMYPKNSEASGETDINVIIAITVSVIGVIALILLVGFLYIMRKRQKQTSYSQRCRPVSLDEYTIDNASVGGSMRKSSALRASKRTYGNLAFDDPALRPNPMGVHDLAKFVQEKLLIFEEFRDVPQITSRLDEVPTGCEDKNRYANVLPLPETRVILQRLNDGEKSEYINANYVTGPKDPPNYYIACQAPLESTVEDFWRMIWEQQSRVIIQATDLIENGVEKCAEYLPPSVTLDNHCSFGDFQITLQNREVKDKYAISTIQLKHVGENATRELTHYWYKWPEMGVPAEETPLIAMLLEARSSLISYAIEQANEDKEKSSMATLKSGEDLKVLANDATTTPAKNSNGSTANGSTGEINGNISMVHIKKTARNQGPLTVHCSPGTGRTGTIIACDIAIRSLETPKRTVDIPQIVYYVRRGRASAVLTKEQYEFIYKVANMYAAKITNPTNYN